MKKGQKIKYSICTDCFGKDIVEVGYYLGEEYDHGDYIWIADTKKDAMNGYGNTILRSSLR